MKKLFFASIVFISIIGIAYLVFKEGTLPVNKKSTSSTIVVIQKGEGLNQIARTLSAEGLIRNRVVFYLVVKQLGIEKKIQAGDFRISPAMSVYEIVDTLQHGTLDEWVTFVEGLRKEEIGSLLTKTFDISEVEFTQIAPEGYLFPDTYLIPKTAGAEDIIKIMKSNFNVKTNPLIASYKAKGLSLKEAVILASLVEREAKFANDRTEVASILLKRLKSDWPLQIDATVQYMLGYQSKEKTWWKQNLTQEDLDIDSPYNTRKNPGLPPNPICNPGLAALTAVAEADVSTPYWYYLSEPSGKTYYSKTLEEHEANIQKYLR